MAYCLSEEEASMIHVAPPMSADGYGRRPSQDSDDQQKE